MSSLASDEALLEKIRQLEEEVTQLGRERDMWQEKALASGQEKIPAQLPLSRRRRTHTASESQHALDKVPDNGERKLNPSKSLRLRSNNSVARLVQDKQSSGKMKSTASKALFNIVQCTDEVCTMAKPESGLITTTHHDITTAKLMWESPPKNILVVKKPGDTPSRNLLCKISQFLVQEMRCNPIIVDPVVLQEEELKDRAELEFMRGWTDAERSKLQSE